MHRAKTSSFLGPVLLSSLVADGHAQSDFEYVAGGTPHGVWFHDASRGWLGEDGGRIRYTTDAGQSWTPATVPDDLRCQLRGIQMLDVGAQDLVGYCVGDDGVVLKSVDSGRTWSQVAVALEPLSLEPATLHQLYFHDADDGWIVGDDAALLHTTDGGQSWTPPPGLPPSVTGVHEGKDFYDLDFPDPGDRLSFVTVLDYGTIARTTDGGATWAETIFDACALCPPPTSGPDCNIELWAVDFGDDQNGSAVGGVGTNNGYAFRSDDGGVTWTQENCFQYVCTPTSCGDVQPTLYGMLAMGAADALAVGYASSVWGRTTLSNPNGSAPCLSCPVGVLGWKQLDDPEANDTNPPLNWVAAVDASTAWCTGWHGIVRKLENQGTTQTDFGTAPWLRVEDGVFVDANNGLLVGQRQVIFRTTDGGNSLQQVYGPGGPGNPLFLGVDASGTQAVVVGTGGRILWSDDGGATWSDAFVPGSQQTYRGARFTPSGNLAYAVGTSGAVRASTDGGQTWMEADPNDDIPASVTLHDVHFSDETTGVVVGTNRSAYITFDNGISWAPLTFNGGIPATLNAVTSDGVRSYTVGDEGQIYSFDLATLQFVHVDLGPLTTRERLNDVALVPGSPHVYVFGDGGLVLRYDGSAWTSPKSQTGTNLMAADFFTETSGMVSGRQTGILAFR